jgi:predicted CXXCH cytochrome family protein
VLVQEWKRRAGWVSMVVVVAGVSGMGWLGLAAAQTAPPPDAGICGSCHYDEALAYTFPAGHAAALDCIACHGDRRPNRVGRRHKTIENCGTCHENVHGHPAKVASRQGRRQTRTCLNCHDPHGTANLHLVRDLVHWRQRLYPVSFTVEAGLTPGGLASPSDPGSGMCEVCHRKTDFYPASGHGESHFSADCTLCHDHTAAFAPIATDSNCVLCHQDETTRLAMPSGHSDKTCATCHAEVSPTPGPGHRAVEACQTCHSEPQTHAPGGMALPCTQCHDPHGSRNINLVRETITTPSGADRPIVFNNLLGLVDGSFASASASGTGVCEICHTTTRHYRADGTGQPHFTFSCLGCHRHDDGFMP